MILAVVFLSTIAILGTTPGVEVSVKASQDSVLPGESVRIDVLLENTSTSDFQIGEVFARTSFCGSERVIPRICESERMCYPPKLGGKSTERSAGLLKSQSGLVLPFMAIPKSFLCSKHDAVIGVEISVELLPKGAGAEESLMLIKAEFPVLEPTASIDKRVLKGYLSELKKSGSQSGPTSIASIAPVIDHEIAERSARIRHELEMDGMDPFSDEFEIQVDTRLQDDLRDSQYFANRLVTTRCFMTSRELTKLTESTEKSLGQETSVLEVSKSRADVFFRPCGLKTEVCLRRFLVVGASVEDEMVRQAATDRLRQCVDSGDEFSAKAAVLWVNDGYDRWSR